MQLLTIGPVHSIIQNTVYALPARSVFITSGATVEISNSSTTGFTTLGSSTVGAQASAAFVRCTTGNTTITLKAAADEDVADSAVNVLAVNTTQAGNSATTAEVDLWTYSLPANILSANGKGVRITIFGTSAANGNNKRSNLYFGATSVSASGTVTVNNGAWKHVAEIIRTGLATQVATGQGVFSVNGGGANSRNDFTTPAENMAGTITIKATGQSPTTGAANDVVFRGAIVELLR